MNERLLECMNKVTDYYTKPNRYAAQDVVDMFLKKEIKVKNEKAVENVQIISAQSNVNSYRLDMDELVKWKNKNNSKYAVRAHLPITSHRKGIGKLLIFSKKVVRKCLKWYMDPVVEQQNEFNASVTASVNAIYNNDIVINQFMQDIEGQVKGIKENYEQAIQQINEKCKMQLQQVSQELNSTKNIELEEIKNKQEQLRSSWELQVTSLQEQVADLQDKNEELEMRLAQEAEKSEALKEKIKEYISKQQLECVQEMDKLNQTLEKTEENIGYLTYKMNKIKKEGIEVKLVEAKEEIKEKDLKVEEEVQLDYFLFENKFRGTEKSIKRNQEQYIKYYKDKKNVLDLGCGRGEFLELLNEHRIPAEGIDVYDEFVDYCKDKGLKAEQKDALSYIKEQEDNSIGGIFMGQVAEHLSNDYLLNLVAGCYEKMEKGAYFVAETPNPTNLSTFTSSFYLDPSHVKPVHPEAFKFMLEYVGFKEVEIIYTENSKSTYRLPLLNASGAANLEEFNSGINCLSDVLMGSLDYAVIAKK